MTRARAGVMSKRRKLPVRTETPQPEGGYEKSHGYGPSHGGPSGPGDAPAASPPVAHEAPDDDEDEDA
jgi:hypothetical protein